MKHEITRKESESEESENASGVIYIRFVSLTVVMASLSCNLSAEFYLNEKNIYINDH